ncbi:MAG: polyphenol oxidase family protein [Leptospirales bacterium]
MFLRHTLLTRLGVDHGFGSRATTQEPEGSRTFRQVHGIEVLEVSGQKQALLREADGGWSSDPSVAISVFTADCLPVLVCAAGGRFVSSLHAGWRGAVRGIVPEGIRRLLESSGNAPGDLVAVIGPSIRACCYPVGPEVWEEIARLHPDFYKDNKGDDRLSLPSLVRLQLESLGVSPGRIGEIDLCTACHPELFYSHRGMGSSRNGRSMLNYIRPSN